MPAPSTSAADGARVDPPERRPRDPSPRAPGPRAAVRRELARALVDLVVLPFRAARYLARRSALVAELREDLARAPAPLATPATRATPATLDASRALAIFVACAEPSGETHAVSLVRALREELRHAGAPPPRFVGLGGARLEAEGVELLARPVDRAVMGLAGVAGSLGWYLDLLERCARRFADDPPDVVVPVDSPALHVPLARIAKRHGIPTVHFVAPQYWGWAPWRTRAYAKAFDRALTILPFEPYWFARRGVAVEHVGHPLLDALEGVAPTRPRAPAPAPAPADERAIVVLCGSRGGVVERNLPWMLAVLRAADAELAHPPIVVAQSSPKERARIDRILAEHARGLDVRLATGDLHAELARARCALSVSGTVLLDLLHHRLPSVVVYRLARREAWLARRFLTAPWFASSNLLAGREVLPEIASTGDDRTALERAVRALVRAHGDDAWRAECVAGLDAAAERLGPPGAARRAAAVVLALASGRVEGADARDGERSPDRSPGRAPAAGASAPRIERSAALAAPAQALAPR